VCFAMCRHVKTNNTLQPPPPFRGPTLGSVREPKEYGSYSEAEARQLFVCLRITNIDSFVSFCHGVSKGKASVLPNSKEEKVMPIDENDAVKGDSKPEYANYLLRYNN
jgi:hypothetical protein